MYEFYFVILKKTYDMNPGISYVNDYYNFNQKSIAETIFNRLPVIHSPLEYCVAHLLTHLPHQIHTSFVGRFYMA